MSKKDKAVASKATTKSTSTKSANRQAVNVGIDAEGAHRLLKGLEAIERADAHLKRQLEW